MNISHRFSKNESGMNHSLSTEICDEKISTHLTALLESYRNINKYT